MNEISHLIRQITAELRVNNGNRNRPVANVKYIYIIHPAHTHRAIIHTLQQVSVSVAEILLAEGRKSRMQMRHVIASRAITAHSATQHLPDMDLHNNYLSARTFSLLCCFMLVTIGVKKFAVREISLRFSVGGCFGFGL